MLKELLEKLQRYYVDRIGRRYAIVRIAAMTIFFIWIISRLLPAPKFPLEKIPHQGSLPENKVFCVSTEKGTMKGFRTDIPKKTNDEIRIVWIGDSSLIIKPEKAVSKVFPKKKANQSNAPKYIPYMLFNNIDWSTDKRPFILLYPLIAGQLYDTYVAILHALDQKPDLIIVTLNPVWLYCNKAISNWDDLLQDAPGILPSRFYDWCLYSLISSPATIATALFSNFLPILESRYEYSSLIKDYFPKYISPSIPEGKSSELISESPINFWLKYEQGLTKRSAVLKQKTILKKYFDPSPDGISSGVVRSIFRALDSKGIPTLVYTSPINPKLMNDPTILERVNSMNESLSQINAAVDNRTIDLWLMNPGHSIKASDYRDLLHLKNADTILQMLKDRIEEKHNQVFQSDRTDNNKK